MVSQDFIIWKKKIFSILVYHGLEAAIKGDWLFTITLPNKNRILKKAYHTIFLHISDNVLIVVA